MKYTLFLLVSVDLHFTVSFQQDGLSFCLK